MATVRRQIAAGWLTLLAAWPVAVWAQAEHRGMAYGGPRSGVAPLAADAAVAAESERLHVDAFDVEQVSRLAPGVALHFTLSASPGALATLRIQGARRDLELHEVQPGLYEGSYSVDPDDRIGADSRVTATLRRGDQVARSVLDEPLRLGAPAPRPEVAPQARSVPGTGAAEGAPGARNVPGTWAREDAPDARNVPGAWPSKGAAGGVHAGTASEFGAAAGADGDAAAAAPGGSVRRGTPVPRHAPPAAALAPAPRVADCADCAVVESIRALGPADVGADADADAGARGGHWLGDLIANHIERRDRLLAHIGSAFGGPPPGPPRERQRVAAANAAHPAYYDAVLRLRSGVAHVRRYAGAPPFAVGDTVRLGAAPGAGLQSSLAPR